MDIVEHIGISYQYFYTVLHKGLNAIQQCDQLKIKFPLQLSEYQQAARDFKSLSTDGIMSGCVAALDGWLCAIKVPSKDEIDDVSSTYSGHYVVNGLNVQAACDASCRFVLASIKRHLVVRMMLERSR